MALGGAPWGLPWRKRPAVAVRQVARFTNSDAGSVRCFLPMARPPCFKSIPILASRPEQPVVQIFLRISNKIWVLGVGS